MMDIMNKIQQYVVHAIILAKIAQDHQIINAQLVDHLIIEFILLLVIHVVVHLITKKMLILLNAIVKLQFIS